MATFSLNDFKHPEHNPRQSDQKQHTHRVACEIVFLPLHPDTGAPLLEERVTL